MQDQHLQIRHWKKNDKLFGWPNHRCGERPNQHDFFEIQSLDINNRPSIVSNVIEIMNEVELEEWKIATITHPLRVMNRVNEV